MTKKTWLQKFEDAPPPHVDVLDKPFSGVGIGGRLLISSPKDIAKHIAAIPRGQTRSIAELRADLAKAAGADATCQLTTGIFTRIAAEVALGQLAQGKKPAEILPFWRAIGPKDRIAAKLSCGPDFIATMRQMEGIQA